MATNLMNAKELLLSSAKTDIEEFAAYWERMQTIAPEEYLVELTDDEWFEQFYEWCGY